MFTSQKAYNEFYDEMKQYAQSQASALFLGWEAVNNAMDVLVDWIITNPDAGIGDLKNYGKTIIVNHLRRAGSERKVVVEGFTQDSVIYKIEKDHGCPKIRLAEIPAGRKHDICVEYWANGKSQAEIAKQFGITKQFISRVILEFKR